MLLSELSAKFAASSPAEAERSIQHGLQSIGEGLGVDWAVLRTLEDHADEARLTGAWTLAGVQPRPTVIREDQAPWIFARLHQGHVVRLVQRGDLPDEAAIDRQSLEELGLWSAVVVPLFEERAVVGWLSVGTVRAARRWPDEWIPRLQLLAEAFATALERQRAARAARESQDAIRDLAGRLVTAQEEERRRIARDLHDDVNQELAAQSIALSTLGDRLPDVTTPAVREEVARLQVRTVDLARAIRHLSHSLHPGTLQHAGLVAALRGYCRDFEREHGLAVTFRGDGELETVSPNVALCLYRVTQEGLGNVARHAGARHACVTVGRNGDNVILTIGDDGGGFDLAEARRRHGLGLISLDERARLVGGCLTIDSQSQRGTQLRIVVPLSEGRDAPRDRAAG
jgi:signal transduction histidine kinase